MVILDLVSQVKWQKWLNKEDRSMTAYEFINYDAGYEYRQKALQCCMQRVYQLILINNPGRDFTTELEYKDAENIFYDVTGSCDKGEACDWLMDFMVQAVAYGFETKNLDWQHKFLAAHNILKNLLDQRAGA